MKHTLIIFAVLLSTSTLVLADVPSTQTVARLEVTFNALAAPAGVGEITANWRFSDSLSLRIRPLIASMSSGGGEKEWITQHRYELNVGLEWDFFRQDWKGFYGILDAGVFEGDVDVPDAEDYDFSGWGVRAGLGYRWRFKQEGVILLEAGHGIGTDDMYESPGGTETNTGSWPFVGLKLGISI